MQKFFIVLLIIFLIYILFKSWLYSLRKKFEKHFSQAVDRRERMVDKGKMVKCANCATYFPVSEAIEKSIHGERFSFCSKECLDKFKDS